ncbi:MAG: FtsQ-type POTRA domain-containing protein [Coriobacteriaceae bacterium]|nr:FtsQ-type POTRA domain-containing protein [Coriobacteriaceae bacterium]
MASNYSRKSASSDSRRRSSTASSRVARPQGRAGGMAPKRTSASRSRVAPGIGSARMSDVQDGRAARMRSRYNRYVRRIVLILSVLVAIVVLYAVLYFAGAFPVTQVTVNGADHLTNEEVAEIAAVPADSTLLRVDDAGIVARLEADAWVESAGVTKIPPGTLQLDIRERTIKAVVQVPSKDGATLEDWAIASDGMWLMKIPERTSAEAAKVSEAVYADAESVLHITGVPYGVEPVAGAYCTDANVTNATDIISGLSDNLASQVKAVEASGTETTTLTLSNGVQIAFGDAEDIREKERVALQLLAEHQGEIAYINVRTPTRPTWRSL